VRNLHDLDTYRDSSPETVKYYGSAGDETCGVFVINSHVDRAPMVVIASSDGGWDHVSVSRKRRCPNWGEMEQAKRMFFKADETAMQLHVPSEDHINIHPYCLHLWRPQLLVIPKPPAIFVGMAMSNAAEKLEDA
jgi:hypothetical protein